MEYDWDRITTLARCYGIKLTNATTDTEICKCWADRVLLAAKDGTRAEQEKWIEEANRYAI
jgi:hypothetical protein